MKQYDIFEREFEGQKMRFQLIELKPYLVTVQTVDIEPPMCRNGNMLLAALPKAALAKKVDGEYVTTPIGESWANRFATYIYNRLTARNKSLHWLIENKDMEPEEANDYVDKLSKKFNDWEVKYLLAVVRWAFNGEIGLERESDIHRVKNVLSTYFTYLGDKNKDESVRIKYDKICFRKKINGQSDAFLWSLDEVEEALRPWADKIIRFNRWPGDNEIKARKDGG